MADKMRNGEPLRGGWVDEAQSLPYPTGSGSSGSEASAEREQHRDMSGITSANQRETLEWLGHRGTYGATQAELQEFLQVGHGTASQVLSNLHAAHRIQRLQARRLRSHVYVLPEYVRDRPVSGYRRLQSRPALRQRIQDLEEALRMVLAFPGNPDVLAEASLALANRLEDDQ